MDQHQSTTCDLTPRPIVALEESVVNRIAAGEIIIRPANAIKELLENCIDAGATSVKITKADLGILCERFTTSKIRKFDDLSSLRTYGFRGEALASISHIAHLTIATKTRSEGVGWKAKYSDGKLVPLKTGGSPDPQPCAGNDGTVITVCTSSSHIFARVIEIQLACLRRISENSRRRYEAGSASPDISTSASATILETIGRLYSDNLKKELMHLEFTDKKLEFKMNGYFSTANYNAKKSITMIFINSSFPYIYISLEIAPDRVDPNVHPNKKEVHFLDQDEIIERIGDKLNVFLAGSNSSRSYNVQTLLPMAPPDDQVLKSSQADSSQQKNSKSTKILPQKLVRTDHRSRTLQSMLRRPTGTSGDDLTPSESNHAEDLPDSQTLVRDINSSSQAPQSTSHTVKIEESLCLLKSIGDLREEIKSKTDSDLENVIKHHTFVGVVDTQKESNLRNFRSRKLQSEELFYQLGVRQFGSFDRIQLKPPVPVKTLVTLAVQSEPSEYLDKIGRSEAVDKICDRLTSKAEMLNEYFSFQIDPSSGNLVTLPLLLPEHAPNMEKLPLFLVRAAVECDWTDEMGCFSSFLRELAFFYAPSRLPLESMSDEQKQTIEEEENEQLKQAIFPSYEEISRSAI
ncbi:hypothetical protein PSHT_15748 [Puccinia striiformis]|uniref:DNA mismatch repair protein S5 domain-containing protein n=1 Tax=Puccinia striiformis TaxID=27350 RepID=A0A2S4UDA1_9BASI|nr:hypothetical protein PSHT_15748 [Puccinia striiformis]